MKHGALLLFVMILCMGQLSAQSRYGIQAGLNMAHISSNDDDINEEKKTIPTWRLGLMTDFGLGKGWSFQPQLLLQGKGTGITHQDHTDKYRFTSLDIPLAFVHTGAKGFYIGGGPNLGFNLAASEKADDGVEKLELGSGTGQLNRFDFGFDLRTGIRTKSGLAMGFNYTKGISNISNASGMRWNNNVLGFSVGYFFGEKK